MTSNKLATRGTIKHISTYGLALFFFLTPFEYPLADLMSTSPVRLVGLLAMALAAIDTLSQKTIRFDYRFLCIALWLAYGFLSHFWAIDMDRFQTYFSMYLNNALMFLLISLVAYTSYEANILKKSMIWGVVALLLYMTFVPGATIYSTYQNRLTLNAGTDGLDQNYLAALMLMPFGIVFYDLCNCRQTKAQKAWIIIFCIVIAYYTLLTGSRSGLLALLLIVLLSINTSWKTRLSIGIPVVIVMFMLLPIIVIYLPEDILERFSLSALTGQEAESGTRLQIWAQALNAIRGFKWVLGCGVGASQTVVGDVLNLGYDAVIHNHYIALLVEVGVVGFVLFMAPIVKMVTKGRQVNRNVSIAFCGILVMAFFLDVLTTKFFWASWILVSLCSTARDNNSEGEGIRT